MKVKLQPILLISLLSGISYGNRDIVSDCITTLLLPQHAVEIARWRKDPLVGLTTLEIVDKLGPAESCSTGPVFGWPMPDASFDLIYSGSGKSDRIIVSMKYDGQNPDKELALQLRKAKCVGVVRGPLAYCFHRGDGD
ncbi:hypothetical protein KF728_29620 [Candidatus Obscuribacterales bacterium]|nr:hypothetical protein [Candidatus Obscuribacterales bacterium]MBX3154348.1 hypothetical protein [Candidatus Obscuribacterales bacterium]